MYWLFKTEPNDYSFHRLQQEGGTTWTGVKNFQAIRNLKAVNEGDEIFIYHTGKEKAIIGAARVTKAAYQHESGDTVVDLVPIYPLRRPVGLGEIKGDPRFFEWELVKQPRLSVMPVTGEHWQLVHELAAK